MRIIYGSNLIGVSWSSPVTTHVWRWLEWLYALVGILRSEHTEKTNAQGTHGHIPLELGVRISALESSPCSPITPSRRHPSAGGLKHKPSWHHITPGFSEDVPGTNNIHTSCNHLHSVLPVHRRPRGYRESGPNPPRVLETTLWPLLVQHVQNLLGEEWEATTTELRTRV